MTTPHQLSMSPTTPRRPTSHPRPARCARTCLAVGSLASLLGLSCSDGDETQLGESTHVDQRGTDETDAREPNDEGTDSLGPDAGAANVTDATDEAEDVDDSVEATDDAPVDDETDAADEAGIDAGTSSTDAEGPAENDSRSPLWVYYATPTQHLVNTSDPTQRVTDFFGNVDQASGVAPWSPDGKRLARENGSKLELFDLVDGSLADSFEVDGLSSVLRWASPDLVLVSTTTADGSGIAGVTASGDVTDIVPAVSGQGFAGHTTSPDGRWFLFSLGGAGDFPFYRVDLTNPLSPSEPALIATHTGSPALSLAWSGDSRWLAFGHSSADGSGIYLWSPADDQAPVRVSPDDTSYTPLHTFSPRGNAFVSFVGSADGSVLLLATLGETVLEVTELARAADQSPASFSPGGSFLHYSGGGAGWVQSVAPDGSVGARSEIPGYDYGCKLSWVDDTEFVYQTCASDAHELLWANAEDPSAALPLPIEDLGALDFAGPCFVHWNDSGTFRVGSLAELRDEPEMATVISPVSQLQRVVTHPTGAGFAWVVGDSFYWQALDDCAPSADPLLIDAGAPVMQLDFVPRP